MPNICQRFRSFLKLFDYPGKPEFKVNNYTNIIDTPELVEKFFRKIWDKSLLGKVEEVYVVYTDVDNQVIDWVHLHKGGTHTCYIDIGLVFEWAYFYHAAGICIAHNHPNGKKQPTQVDIEITNQIRQTCLTLKRFTLLDHTILTTKGYYSFAKSGRLD